VSTLPAFAAVKGADLEVRVKAVPGARRDEIAGPLGDRLKIRVAQPPEAGKANEAIRQLLAERLGVAARAIVLASGAAHPAKTFVVSGLAGTAAEACAKLA
jgi:uncharacterized protein YggU (UPF0235/DUF167 family)